MNGRGTTTIVAVFAIVLLAMTVGYLVFQSYKPPASASPPVTPETRQFHLYLHTFSAGDEKVHQWVPSGIVVNARDTVILRITNADPESAHGFSLGALNVTIPSIPSGQTVTVRFEAKRPGIYRYGCALTGCATDHASQNGQFIILGGP
jgi:heme/copper-type cytochrome/quinol oxidase subunit 2